MVGGHMMYKQLMLVVCYLLLIGCTYGARTQRRKEQHHDEQQPSTTGPSLKHKSREAVIKAFEHKFLNMFGLKEKPTPSGKVHVPQYMLDLYNAQASSPISSMNFNIKGTSTRTANTVRSFHHHDHENDYGNLLLDEFSPKEHTHRLTFNVSTITENEILTAAELRLFRKSIHSVSRRDVTSMDNSRDTTNYKHRVNVYQILKPVVKNRDVIKRLIDTKVVDIRNASWESFDVRPAILDWWKSPRLNHGIEVEVLDHRGRPSQLTNLRISRSVHESELEDSEDEETRWLEERPLIVTYTDDGRHKRASGSGRSSRERNGNRKRRLRLNCHRHELYVDFTDVGWNTWIVAPPGYQAYYCQGECPFPLVDHLNATNHAIVQTLVNSASPQIAPKACCVPTELSPISMLYLDDMKSVILRNYQDMVVEGCGCR